MSFSQTIIKLFLGVIVIASGLIGSAQSARATDYATESRAIFANVTSDIATYDAALPQLEALVTQAGTNRENLADIMDGMYRYIPPRSEAGTITNRLKLARVIENEIVSKFANMTKYAGALTDDIWINLDTNNVLTYQMRPIDENTAYLKMGELRLLAVPDSSPNYLVGDEDLGLGRCDWSVADNCSLTEPGAAPDVIRAFASAQPSEALVGQTLTPAPTFSTTPWRVVYEWIRVSEQSGDVVVQLSTNPSYTVQPADVNQKLKCLVYVSKAGYAMYPYGGAEQGGWLDIPVKPTAPMDKAFSKTYTPKISGTTRVGKTLSASVKTWSPKASFSYQWLRNGTAIAGATKSKYTLTAADLSSVISVAVTGSRTGYASATKTSASTKVITPGIITRGKIKITGTGRVGRVRTASTSKWTSGVTFTYQWYRNGVFIEGATAKTYTQSPADKGKRLTVVVTASKNGYISPVSKASKRTGKIKTGYLTKVTPLITGDAIVGQVLTVTPGTWKPVDTTFTYQWYRNGKKITGQTGVSYTVQAGDVGKTIKVKVTGKALAYYTSYRYSHSTAKVVAAIVPTPTPTPSPSPSPSPTPSESVAPSPSPSSTP